MLFFRQILDVVLEVLSKLSEEYKGDIKSRVEGIEHVMKASLVGQTLPLLASVLSSDKFLGLPVAKSYLPVVTNVTVTATRVRSTESSFLGNKIRLTFDLPYEWCPHCNSPFPKL